MIPSDYYTNYGWTLLASIVFATMLGQYAWRRRATPGALPFVGMMVFGTSWVVASVLQITSAGLAAKLFWEQIQGVAALLAATASFCFALAYANLSKWLTPRILALLAIPPAIYALLGLTNRTHHLAWTRVWLDAGGTIRTTSGPATLILTAYGYLLVLLTWAILVWLFIRSPRHRSPVGMVLIAQVATRIAYVIYATSRNPAASLLPVILIDILGYLLYFLALFRFSGFDLVPTAWGTAIARMSDGMLVLDDHNRVIEINPTAQTLLDVGPAQLIDQDATELWAALPGFVDAVRATEVGHAEVELDTGVARRTLAITVSPLPYDGGQRRGRLMLLRDITEHKRAEMELEQTNSELEGIFRALPDLYFRLSSDGTILDYRAGQAADLYLSPQMFLRRRMQDVLPPETGRLVAESIQETLRTTTTVSLEYSLPMAGDISFFEARLQPLRGDEIIMVVRNITERMESHAALQRAYGEMERRVAERTIELQQANDALSRENVDRQRAETALRTLNATLEERVADRTRELAALYEVSAAAARIENQAEFLEAALGITVKALRSESGAILLRAEQGGASEAGRLHVAAMQGLPPPLLTGGDVSPARDSLSDEVLASRQPLLIADLTADGHGPASLPAGDPKTLLLAPLQADGEIVGVAGLARDAAFSFNVEEVALLTTIADQIAVAVQSHHLRRMAQRAGLLAERQRVARDLHNSVTQSLYGLVTFAEAGQAQLEGGDLAGANRSLARIGETTRQALREMRLFIHQAHPEVLEQEGLVGALQLRLAAVEGRADMRVNLCTDEWLRLPLPTESALYQVAQEALNNVLRHACATSVVVVLRCEGDQVVLQVSDDGRGFDTVHPGHGGMGLGNMRDVLQEVRGTLEIISAPGTGTAVRATVPSKG